MNGETVQAERLLSHGMGASVLWLALTLAPIIHGQLVQPSCMPPFCVTRADDSASNPLPGMLRYALLRAESGTVVTFDPALNGRAITLDTGAPTDYIRIATDVMIQGPGSNHLTIDGGGGTRIFLIAGSNVQISGLTLANGLAKGSDGGNGTGGAGGGGGAAGMGGAIFLDGGSLALNGVELRGNRAVGGDGGQGGPSVIAGNGGAGGAAVIQKILAKSGASADASFGSGGAGGACRAEDGIATGQPGAAGGFGGGSGGAGAFLDREGNRSAAGGGAGGAGLGGAIFASSGFLQLFNTTFIDNHSIGGSGANGAGPGPAKGGALFVCTSFFCGPGHEGAAIFSDTSFRTNSATDGGMDERCAGRDDADVCGRLGASTPTRFTVLAPPYVTPGERFSLMVTAVDTNQNPVFTYAGEVHIASTDKESVLPSDVRVSDGKGSFPAILKTTGGQTITVSGTNGAEPITGTSNPITVVNAEGSDTSATEYTPAPFQKPTVQ